MLMRHPIKWENIEMQETERERLKRYLQQVREEGLYYTRMEGLVSERHTENSSKIIGRKVVDTYTKSVGF